MSDQNAVGTGRHCCIAVTRLTGMLNCGCPEGQRLRSEICQTPR